MTVHWLSWRRRIAWWRPWPRASITQPHTGTRRRRPDPFPHPQPTPPPWVNDETRP